MTSGAKSQTPKRSRRCTKVFAKAKVSPSSFSSAAASDPGLLQAAHAQLKTSTVDISTIIDEGLRLVDELLALCVYQVAKETTLSLYKQFPKLYRLAPTTLIIPLQTSLNVSLPSDASRTATHKPFPDNLATFQSQSSLSIRSPAPLTPRRLLRRNRHHELAPETSQDLDLGQRWSDLRIPLQAD